MALKGVNDVVDTVRLVQTDAEGNSLAEVGSMTDGGQNGDFDAGDGEYTTTLTVHESAPVTRYYQAVVSLKNDSRKTLSEVEEFRITDKPYSKEPDEDKMIYGMGYPFAVNQIIVRLHEGEKNHRPSFSRPGPWEGRWLYPNTEFVSVGSAYRDSRRIGIND